MIRLEAALASRRWRLSIAFVLGAVATLIFAPFHAFPIGILSFSGLMVLLGRCVSPGQAFWTGWFFGWGHFIAGLYWIASAFLVEPEKFAWLIPFPVLGLPALLSVFPAVAVMLAWRIAPAGAARILALAATWTLLELARGTVLTGFPWNLVGYAWGVHITTMQAASWFGTYGLSFLAILVFSAPSLITAGRNFRRAAAVLFALPLLAVAVAAPKAFVPNNEDSFTVRLVQGNIEQRYKWRPDRVEQNFDRLVRMSEAGDRPPDLVIWPETSATFLLSRRPDKLQALGVVAAIGASGTMITGAPRLSGDRVYNSAVAIDASGKMIAASDKHHLVPFGEYLPLRPLLQTLGLEKLAAGRGDFAAGGPQQTLTLPSLPDAAILICYEAIFPSLAGRDVRPGWLLNLTNDGWFGNLTGPDQHFAMARFRAVEQGLPLVRAAGTGISAVVTRTGLVTAHLPLGARGTLDAQVAFGGSMTPYSRTGSAPVVALMLLLMVALFFIQRRRRD